MVAAIPLTWLQLKREKTRLAMAVLGVGFAVVLVFMQLGFRDALFEGSVRYHNAFDYDLAMISPKTDARVVEVNIRLDDAKAAALLTNLQVKVEIRP